MRQNAFTGEQWTGPQTIAVTDVPLAQMPLFHRAGGMMLTTSSSEFANIHDADTDTIAIQCWQPFDQACSSGAVTKSCLSNRRFSLPAIGEWRVPLFCVAFQLYTVYNL